MKITSHGKWAEYKPDKKLLERRKLPPEAWDRLVFIRRVNGGEDWYDYRDTFSGKTVLATVYEQYDGLIIGAANRDAHKVFPDNGLLIEIEGYSGPDPQAHFGNKIYDAKARTFTARKPLPPLPPSPEVAELKTEIEELKTMVAGLLKRK